MCAVWTSINPTKDLQSQLFHFGQLQRKQTVNVFWVSLSVISPANRIWISDSNCKIISRFLETIQWSSPVGYVRTTKNSQTDANSLACFYCWVCKLVYCSARTVATICPYYPNDGSFLLLECLHCSKHSSLAAVLFWLQQLLFFITSAAACQVKMAIWWYNGLL